MDRDAHNEMKWRWVRRALLRLALGLATTILIAWICAAYLPVGGWGPVPQLGWNAGMLTDAEVNGWNLPAAPSDSGYTDHWFAMGGLGWFEAYFSTEENYPPPPMATEWRSLPTVRRAGWPLYATESSVEQVDSYRGVSFPRRWQLPWGEIYRRGIGTRALGFAKDSRLGLIPFWPGLILDTLLYAGIWAGAIGGIRAIARLAKNRARGFDVIVP